MPKSMAALSLLKLQPQPGVDVVTQIRHALGANHGKVIDIFRDLDEDGNGVITRGELARMLPVLGLGVSREEADDFFDSLDTDGSDSIDFHELKNKLRVGADMEVDESLRTGAAGRIEVVSMNANALREGVLLNNISGVLGVGAQLKTDGNRSVSEQVRDALADNLARVIDLFHEWDANGDGRIAKSEFRKALTVLGLRASSDEMDALFHEFDVDRSGFIDYRELRAHLRRRLSDRGPKPPRPPLWVAKSIRPKVPLPSLMDNAEAHSMPSDTLPATMDDAAAAPDPGPGVQPGDAPRARVAFARAEAVLLGQLSFLPRPSVGLSQKRVRALSSLLERVDRDEERRAHQRELENRRESTLASRLRGERAKEAEQRQSAAISGVRSATVAANPKARAKMHADIDEASATSVISASAISMKGAISLEDACFGVPTASSACQSASGTNSSKLRLASDSRRAVSVMSASMSSIGSPGRSGIAAITMPSSQLGWQYDIADGRPLIKQCGQSALNCATTKSNQLGHRQAAWVGSLRRTETLPSLPMPLRSESVRAGLRDMMQVRTKPPAPMLDHTL